jgi:hypothetical protein
MNFLFLLTLGSLFANFASADISDALLNLSSNGFLHGSLTNQKLTLKLKSVHHLALSAPSFTFNDLPTNSRFKSPIFKIVPNQSSFNRPVWSNGREYLYFIMNPDDSRAAYGTWLVGKDIGVDSGLAYLKPKQLTVIPLGQEMEGSNWHILDKSWIPNESITLSVPSSSSSPIQYLDYYEVEYLKDSTLRSSILLLTPPPTNLPKDLLKNVLELSNPETISLSALTIPSSKLQYPLLWSSSQSWITFTLIYSIPLASPVILSRSSSASSSSSSSKKHRFLTTSQSLASISEQETIGHLINDEYLETGWRLSFRLTDEGKELELMIALDNNGLHDGFFISSTSPPASYQDQLIEKFDQMQVGEYAWLWFEISSDPQAPTRASDTDNLILHCIYRDKDQIIFEYFHSDRRDAMARSMLSHTMSYLVAKRIPSSSSNSSKTPFPYRLSIDDHKPLQVLTLFKIGANPVQWIADYLVAHENALAPELSSCFMYHAGTTIPQQFIYAAEIICFLLGAKPITMVFLLSLSFFLFSLLSSLSLPSLSLLRSSTLPLQIISGSSLS